MIMQRDLNSKIFATDFAIIAWSVMFGFHMSPHVPAGFLLIVRTYPTSVKSVNVSKVIG